MLIFTVGCGSADFWSGSIGTNSTSWEIHRVSSNINFYYEQHVSGKIRPIDGPNNRSLSPYYSCSSNVNINDISIKERISALNGKYKTDEIEAMAARNDNIIESDLNKPSGSDEYAITYHEVWPVVMVQLKSIAYSGKGINAREIAGNNLDFAKANFIYSNDLIKDITIRLGLSKLNATVIANDNGIQTATLEATRSTEFKVRASTTGISDLSYLQSGPRYTGKPITGYQVLNEGDERYYGKYNMTSIIRMQSIENAFEPEGGWLSCCNGGWDDVSLSDKASCGTNISNIFDCTYYSAPIKRD